MSPNGLYGSMGLNGVAVLIALRQRFPDMLITETHPKVFHWHLYKQKYDYAKNQRTMCGKSFRKKIFQVLSLGLVIFGDQYGHRCDNSLKAWPPVMWPATLVLAALPSPFPKGNSIVADPIAVAGANPPS